MTTRQSPIYLSNLIWFSLTLVILFFSTFLVIYVIKRMWRKKQHKLVWTPISSVERRSNLSHDQFVREYASIGKPVIITDAMKDWTASTKWNMNFFKSECGSLNIKVREDGDHSRTLQMTVADYIDYITASDRKKILYLFDFHPYLHPKLYEDYKVPVYFHNLFDRLPKNFQEKYDYPLDYLLIGPKDSYISLHIDGEYAYAWLALISGRKKCVLFTPDQTDLLYNGEVNVFNPDLEKFPLYTNAKSVEIILEAGEIIYFPPRWWHQVKNLEDSIAVSHNSINEFNSELCFQDIYERNPIKGFILPLALEFPLVFRSLFAIKLLLNK